MTTPPGMSSPPARAVQARLAECPFRFGAKNGVTQGGLISFLCDYELKNPRTASEFQAKSAARRDWYVKVYKNAAARINDRQM